MAKRHVMTPRRRIALRKAQLVSAKKRRKPASAKTRAKRFAKRTAVTVGVLGVAGAGIAYAGTHQRSMTGGLHRRRVPLTKPPKEKPRNRVVWDVKRNRPRGWDNPEKSFGTPKKQKPMYMTPSVITGRAVRGKTKTSILWSQPTNTHVMTGRGVRYSPKPHHQPLIHSKDETAAAVRTRKNIIGPVRSARGVTPKVNVGPLKFDKYSKGVLKGETRVRRRYNR